MSNAKLVIRQPGKAVCKLSITSDDGDISIGRAPDNTIPLEGDSDASRYHAVIEARTDGFYISDLGSTNGTTVNRRRIEGERLLQNEDVISVGGSSTIEFELIALTSSDHVNGVAASRAAGAPSSSSRPPQRHSARTQSDDEGFAQLGATQSAQSDAVSASTSPIVAGPPPQPRSVSPLFLAAFGVLMLGLAVGAGLLIYNLFTPPSPPQNNLVRASPTPDIFGTPTPDMTEASPTPSPVVAPTETPGGTQANTTGGAGDIGQMARVFAAQVSGQNYVFEPDFVNRIRAGAEQIARTAQASNTNYSQQAYANRRAINRAFSNTKPLIGYTLALSRSGFDPSVRGDEGLGLWRVPPAIAQNGGYLGANESPETALLDPVRSSEVAAAYYKSLKDSFDEEDFMYAIACFGSSLDEVGQLREQLQRRTPEDRRNFWRMVTSNVVSADKAARVVRFFAAGIVGENPQAFGLTVRPLSSLSSSQF